MIVPLEGAALHRAARLSAAASGLDLVSYSTTGDLIDQAVITARSMWSNAGTVSLNLGHCQARHGEIPLEDPLAYWIWPNLTSLFHLLMSRIMGC